MGPEEAVKQLECAVDASQDDAGSRVAATYKPTFERVAERGSSRDVYSLATELACDVCDGGRLTPAEVNERAESLLEDRAYTDGGD